MAGDGADRNDWYSGRAGETVQDLRNVDVKRVGEICFIKQDQWTRAALLRDDQIAFDASLVEIAIEAADDKQDVDVGSEDLFLN